MAQVSIHKCKDFQSMTERFPEMARALAETLRQRTFVVWAPASELVDDEKEFRARIALPGFEAKDIDVSATPNVLVIQAGATHVHTQKTGTVCFCEFSGNALFRRFDLPSSVDVDRVTASMTRGMLQVTAPKATLRQVAARA